MFELTIINRINVCLQLMCVCLCLGSRCVMSRCTSCHPFLEVRNHIPSGQSLQPQTTLDSRQVMQYACNTDNHSPQAHTTTVQVRTYVAFASMHQHSASAAPKGTRHKRAIPLRASGGSSHVTSANAAQCPYCVAARSTREALASLQ